MNQLKEKTKCNRIDQRNMEFEFNGKTETKLNYDIFEKIYLNSLKNHDGVQFNMKDRLKKVNFKRTKQENEDNIDMFTIHSTKIEKVLFSDIWKGRHLYSDHCTVPNNSVYCE